MSEMAQICSDKKQEKAKGRLGTLKQLGRYISRKAGTIQSFAKRQNVPLRTLHRWRANYRKNGILGLVDKRGRPSAITKADVALLDVVSRIKLGQILVDNLYRRDRKQLLSLLGSGGHVKGEVQGIARKILRRKS